MALSRSSSRSVKPSNSRRDTSSSEANKARRALSLFRYSSSPVCTARKCVAPACSTLLSACRFSHSQTNEKVATDHSRPAAAMANIGCRGLNQWRRYGRGDDMNILLGADYARHELTQSLRNRLRTLPMANVKCGLSFLAGEQELDTFNGTRALRRSRPLNRCRIAAR